MNTRCETCGWMHGHAYGCRGELSPDPTVNRVIAQMVERSKAGLEKYGVTTAGNPLLASEWLRHTKHELMDAVIYLEREEKASAELERQLAIAVEALQSFARFGGWASVDAIARAAGMALFAMSTQTG